MKMKKIKIKGIENTGVVGVTSHGNKYQARVKVGDKNLYLGLYNNIETAQAIRLIIIAIKKHYKKLAEEKTSDKVLINKIITSQIDKCLNRLSFLKHF
jgi:hypothetical protein